MKKLKIIITLLIVVTASFFILWLMVNEPVVFNIFSNQNYNKEINYQIITLMLALIIIIVTGFIGGRGVYKYLNLKNIDGKINPVRAIGINPGENESWLNLGINFSIIITTVTTLVSYFQIVSGQNFVFEIYPVFFYIILFAIINSFVEEIIYRFSITAIFQQLGISENITALSSGGIFGLIHYFGNPGGIFGVIMAGFIGWFLSKSIIETKGFFWAWSIHFFQDIVIFYFLFAV